ncbi:MAG: helix-turn-helix domain-containing protein [Bacteroidia bacterium]
MSSLSKLFNYLDVNFISAEMREVTQPFRFSGLAIPVNAFVQLNQGNYYIGAEMIPMMEGSFYFRPAGSIVDSSVGKSDSYLTFTKEQGFPSAEQLSKLQKVISPFEVVSGKKEVYSSVVFDVLVHNSFSLFETLQLPLIPFPAEKEFSTLVRRMCEESYENKPGKERMLKTFTEELVIQILRYIATLPEYNKNLDKINFLADKRLTSIVEYISSNIGGDLSNKQLAEVCFLSEGYIGQYFKMLTDQNLQDFVEHQRLELALQKMNTTSDSIAEIAFSVGFADPAYFSRRFKMKYNLNANTFRNSGSSFS